jgi:Sulfotransferase family
VALLEITDVVPPPTNEGLRAYYLDNPISGTSFDRTTFEVAGWLIGTRSQAREVQLWDRDILLRTIPVNVARPDVVAVHAGAPERTGFSSLVGTLGLEPDFKLELRAVLEDGTVAELGVICGSRQAIASAQTRMSPVLVTSLGRTGTTLLMGLLSAHPAIVGERTYPYEIFPARYWLHLLRVLGEPADHAESSHPSTFASDLRRIGHNPFHTVSATNHSELADHLGRSYVERLARFCQESIDEFYAAVAAADRKRDAQFFVEKFQPDHLPRLAWELYPRAKEIILVRDFRDLICSVFAFNGKRQTAEFGRDQVASDEDYVRYIGWGAERLVNAWKSRCTISELVRYEDLATRPAETLKRLLTYLELDPEPETIDEMVRAAFDHPAVDSHRTSQSVEESIGRWQRELPPSLLPAIREALDEPLSAFGYQR